MKNKFSDKYEIEKTVFSHLDYEQMGWHDNYIHSFGFKYKEGNSYSLFFDIDYIIKWNRPIPPEEYYSFWIAPCTLKFIKVYNLLINIDDNGSVLEPLQISDLILKEKYKQEKNKWVYDWYLDLKNGKISFSSYGFKQIVRNSPILTDNQMLTDEERDGISFEEEPFINSK